MKASDDGQLAAVNDALKRAFAPDELTKVILVHAFKKGDRLVLSEPAMEFTPSAPSDLHLEI